MLDPVDMDLKGIVLAGGIGARLHPLTRGTSKQLLPIWDKPMIYHPLSVLMLAGIQDILVITTPEDHSAFERVLGDGGRFGVRLSYAAQPRPEGVAQALLIGADFLAGGPVCIVLGDNLFYGDGFTGKLREAAAHRRGATIFAHAVGQPERFGVVELDGDGCPVSIEEKPSRPRSNFAVTGLYFYDNQAVEIASHLSPSARGELEITDVNRAYLAAGSLHVVQLGRGFAWFDMGTPESLIEAGQFVHALEERQAVKIACLEEIGWASGWLDDDGLRAAARGVSATSYGPYLASLLDE